MPTIPIAAWAPIQSAYRNELPPEARDEIEEATEAFKRTTTDFVSMAPAIKRLQRVRTLARKLRDEWAKGRDLSRGADDAFFADILIARNYPTPHTGHGAPPWDDLNRVLLACDAAEAELKRMKNSGPGSLKRLQSLAWDRWVVELSGILRSHGLPSGPGVTETKTGVRASMFGELIRAVQQHAFPGREWPHATSSIEALDKAIQRALGAIAQGQD
jgi:hypothetical protein